MRCVRWVVLVLQMWKFLTLHFFWPSTLSSPPARAQLQPKERHFLNCDDTSSHGISSNVPPPTYYRFNLYDKKIFDLKEIGAGAILHQLLLCPCDCHQPIFAYFNLAVIVMMNENAGCDNDVTWGAESSEGYQAGLFHLQPALPPGTCISTFLAFPHCCVFASTRHLHSLFLYHVDSTSCIN